MDELAEQKDAQRVPPEALELGGVYQMRSRNVAFGVYTGDGEFIGIRTKFAKRFVEHYARNLDQEWDWDTHEGTATPLMKVGEIPEGIDLKHGWNPPDEDPGFVPVASTEPRSPAAGE